MNAAVEKSVSPDGISKMLSIPKPDSFTHLPEIILQVTNLEPKGKSYGYLSIFFFCISFPLLLVFLSTYI
jgi:hypothetical protein